MGKDQELVQAIRNNDVGQVKNILAKFKTKSKKTSKKGGVHIVDPDGFTPLHHAALSGNGEIVMALLEHVNDVNVKDKKGMTPLHLASWAGKVEPALLLLDAGAQTNLCSRSGATPLHLASEHGNYVVVERLVDHDCDPTVVNNQGETALDLACRFGHLEAVRILLNNSHGKCEKLLNPKEFQEKASPLHMAAKTGHYDVVKLLVENGADISQKGPDGTCLHEAALYGKTDIVKYLIEAGIDVNIKNREGQTALDMVSQFIKSGACSEIKHLLREASVEVVYAKAIRDYCNIKDESFLTLRLGDIVLVLDRRKDGMWKGCVRDDQKERIGFFPSSAVKVLRSPSRNSVRSSTSSTDGLKVSTTATVSNTFEIVTVATPNQPVAAKSRAPKMSSFRKKAAPKSTELSSRLHSGDGRTAAPMENGDKNQGLSNGAPRTQSEGHLEERKKKLNYLDIVLVEKHNSISQREGPSSAPPTKTEYADVWLPKTNFMDATDGARTAHVHERRERLNTGQLQQRPEQERLRQELQRQQEQRQHRPEEQWRTELQQQELQRREHERLRSHGQHPPMSQLDLQAQQPCPPLPAKSRHYTMSSLSTNSEDLPALPLKKRHSLSGRPLPHTPNEPSIPLKLDKKVRTSFRGDRRGTSPPPPPPPPPVSSTPSPVSTDVSPEETKPPPPIAKSNRQNNVGPVFQADETSSNVPHQASLSTSPSPPPPLPPPASPPSPSLSPPTSPPPAFPPPAPPPPPPSSGTETETLTSPSTSSLGDFPPPPPSLIAETPENEESKVGVSLPPPDADYAPYRPRQNTCPLTIPDSDGQNTPKQEPLWGKVSEIRQASTLPAPNDVRSRTGYEDMSRLKRTWTKPEVLLDKKGYVVVTPVNRPPSPVTPAPKVETSSSLVYENFTPLRARLQYQQRSQSEPVYSSISGQDSGASEQPLSPTNKPEKPCRHRYVNCEVSEGHRVTENKQNENNPQDTPQNSPENCSNISDEVPPPPISFPIPTSTPASDTNPNTNPRLSEYDDLYEWLAQSKLLTYMDNFAGAGFDLSAITGLTGEDLSEMEITKTGHRKRLLSEAAKLPRPDLSPKNDVPSWLAHLGLSRYEGNFMDGGFDDIEFLNDLSLEDLRAIGITRLGHQRKILMAVQRLQQRASSESSSWIVEVSDHTKNMKEQSKVPLGGHGSVGGSFTRDSENSTAGLSVGEYAVPRVSHYNEIKPVKTESDTDPSDEIEWAKSSSRQKKTTGDISAEGSGRIIEAPQITFAEEDRNMESCVDNAPAVNGTLHDEDNVDGVKELAASFQHAIRVETEKAKGKPPPVKPKVFKKPPPVVAPKPKPAKHKVDQVEQNSADVNAKVDFTEVIKEAEALSESGSESPPSTLGRGQKSESGVSLEGSLNTNTSGSQGSLNSESEDFQREIKESLHQRKPSHTSAEDIHEQLTRTLTLSQEDLLEQQKLEEEVQKYQSKQNKTDMLFTDIQGMLDNLNTELDDMFK